MFHTPNWLDWINQLELGFSSYLVLGAYFVCYNSFHRSILMASHPLSDPISCVSTLILFGVGSVVMRSAGCVINDLWDQKLDRMVWHRVLSFYWQLSHWQVERTRLRPIAAKQISTNSALVFLSAQLLCGLGVLAQLNHFTILLGASSLILVVLYPLAKRITFWPQAVLGEFLGSEWFDVERVDV